MLLPPWAEMMTFAVSLDCLQLQEDGNQTGSLEVLIGGPLSWLLTVQLQLNILVRLLGFDGQQQSQARLT